MSRSITVHDLESERPVLTRYCYRMLGSAADTDDAVQETIIRAAAALDRYDPNQAKLSTWLYRIATNVCLDALRAARRRGLVLDTAAEGPLGSPLSADRWVEPLPGRTLFGTEDPADSLIERESVRLAFVATLQRLTPRQRAVFLLRDVLSYSAQESADILETSVASVNSALQRARKVIEPPAPGELSSADEQLLERYIVAFESHDVAALTEILREDAITSMPPFDWILRGGIRIASLMADSDACARDRLLLTDVNGVPGLAQYRPDSAGVLRPFALIAVDFHDGRIASTVTFLGTGDRFPEFGLPEILQAR